MDVPIPRPAAPPALVTAAALAAVAALASVVTVLAGCTPDASPSPEPLTSAGAQASGPPVLGIDWGRAASVERPANFEQTVAPSYVAVHPILRFGGQATMADIVPLPAGGFVSVGYSPPAWTPLAWTSGDGSRWSIHELGTTEFTFPEALAVGADGTVVAVGRSGPEPVAWTSRDGAVWQRHAVDVLGRDGTAERMTSVAAGRGGFLAGGSAGPELAERHARFWTSPDGVTWRPVADDAAAFADAEVRGITAFEGGFVAVGVLGTAQRQSGGVAWTSPDGEHWSRVDDPGFAEALVQEVVAAPFGGLVAVGTSDEHREAVAWTSPDGGTWTRAPTEESRLYPGYGDKAGFIQMVDVTAVGGEVLAIGGFQGLQRGTATSWVSTDGLHWRQAVPAPVQQQAEFYAVAAGGPGAIAVGAFGAPDSYVAQVWLTPARE